MSADPDLSNAHRRPASLARRLHDRYGVRADAVAAAYRELCERQRPRYERLWTYYRNPMLPVARRGHSSSERPYRQGQEWGMPARLTGQLTGDIAPAALPLGSPARKDIVIENDIGWRVDAMVDHLFGRELAIDSTAPDPARARLLGSVVRRVFERHGGLGFFQQLALLGMVYGFVDVVVHHEPDAAADHHDEPTPPHGVSPHEPDVDANGIRRTTGSNSHASTGTAHGTGGPTAPGGAAATDDADGRGRGDDPDGRLIERLARQLRLDIVHPSHALPVRGAGPAGDPSALTAYARVVSFEPAGRTNPPRGAWWTRLLTPLTGPLAGVVGGPGGELPADFQVLTPRYRLRVVDGAVVEERPLAVGRLPVVHVQNLAVPFDYAGRSDVEPLIPLQDELNTRLSDRAHRITMQSFKMYLAKGIDNFLSVPVGPGRMWSTDNEAAEVVEFGGDADCPSEAQHIADLREALDKASGVPPVAAGLIRDRVGQLSSAAALRVTLQALLAKTDRKRATYGRGIADLAELILLHLHVAGALPSTADERSVRVTWPSPLPESGLDRLREAELKLKLGIPPDTVRRELGY